MQMILLILAATITVGAQIAVPPSTTISPEHPLILLQVSAAFGDTDEAPQGSDRFAEAERHGLEIVRLWNLLPADIKPYCQLQVELRVHDHDLRLELFRHMLKDPQSIGVPVSVQIADPQDEYVFNPAHVERLLEELSCIRSLMLSEQRFAHYAQFNVEAYATPPHTRYTCDIIKLAAKHGRHAIIVLQGLKWLHVSADTLNLPLLETMRAYPDHVIPLNEHIEPRHLVRQTATWGLWLGGYASQWGVEPQSWWYESSFMNGPGIFGDHLHPLKMPPAFYRIMILQGAAMGASVFSFEPWWDLFDYDNSCCWKEIILPSLLEVIQKKLIPSREQVVQKTAVAYQIAPARTINEFHLNLRDLDWLSDNGLLAKAAYGVWEPMLEFELIPNKSNWFIPLFPPGTPKTVLDQFPCVLQPGQCDSVEAWEGLLRRYSTSTTAAGTAWTCSINGHAYVMQTHENLYERQSYTLSLPKPVRGLKATMTQGKSLQLEWPADPGATTYYVLYAPGIPDPDIRTRLKTIAETTQPVFTDSPFSQGLYAVTARTQSTESVSGTVNYLDCLVLSEIVSDPVEYVCSDENGNVRVMPIPQTPDNRPASQVVYPTFEGVAEAHRPLADEIVTRIDELKRAYENMDWRAVTNAYSPNYVDANGFHREYVSRAWKWWFRRNNRAFMIRQVRCWDFSKYEQTGLVKVNMLLLCTAVRRDDQPFGYDGIVRIPRHRGAEVTCTWTREKGVWSILQTDPSLPNLEEILWNSRPMDKDEKLVPGTDE
jgi:hypothetical protein